MEGKKNCYWKAALNLTFSIIATILVIVVGIRGILFFMPFVVAWIIALIATPMVKWLERRLKIVRKLGSAIIIVFVLAAIIGITYLVVTRLWEVGSEYVQELPAYYAQLSEALETLYQNVDGTVHLFPENIRTSIIGLISNLETYVAAFISTLSEPLVEGASKVAMQIPSFLISFILMVVAAYFFIAQREEFVTWVKKVTPMSIQKRMQIINHNLVYAVWGYIKAQLQIMVVIFGVLVVAFAIIGQPYIALKSLLIAVLDFFPVLGTGTILIPWMLFELVMGNYRLAFILLIIYIVTLVTHQLIQPKLVADRVGLNPIFTLVLLYVGYQFGSVLGMVVAIPIGLIVVNLYKAGGFDYLIDDVKILKQGIMELRNKEEKDEK